MLREPFEALGKYPSSTAADWISVTVLNFTAIHCCNRWSAVRTVLGCTLLLSLIAPGMPWTPVREVVDFTLFATLCVLHQREVD